MKNPTLITRPDFYEMVDHNAKESLEHGITAEEAVENIMQVLF